MHTENHPKCCQITKIPFLLYEIDATEKDGVIRFPTRRRNTDFWAYTMKNDQKHEKMYPNQ